MSHKFSVEYREMSISLPVEDELRELVHGVSFAVRPGESYGLVGESGSGKSLTIRAAMQLLPNRSVVTGEVQVNGRSVLGLQGSALRKFRSTEIGMIFQDPRAHINPVHTVGDFLTEGLIRVQGRSRTDAVDAVTATLRSVGIVDAQRRMDQYPWELSGGLLQRVMIASVLAAEPDVILADEPTTALDVTTQEEVMAILDEQRRLRDLSMIFITHDLDLASAVCDKISVMKAGAIVETLSASGLHSVASHDYTKALLAARPDLGVRSERHTSPIVIPRLGRVSSAKRIDPGREERADAAQPIVEARSLRKVYRVRKADAFGREDFVAVDDVSFAVPPGGSLAIVGESGSGKTTCAKMLLATERPTSGEVVVDGKVWTGRSLSTRDRRWRGGIVQIVFQDPYLSLDRRQRVGDAIAEAVALHEDLDRAQRRERVGELLDQVSLDRRFAQVLPGQLSGGQRQRIAIARALAARPEALVLDEAVSALDVIVQSQVLELLSDIRHSENIALVFITHDLAVVRQVSEEMIVMKSGKVVERGTVDQVLSDPAEQYTKTLISSVPIRGWKPERRLDVA